MNIQFNDNEQLLKDLQEVFITLGEREAVFMSHHDLADATPNYSSDEWKQFLSHPKVRDYIIEEVMLKKEFQIKRMINTADSVERSVGAAQMLNALNKADLGIQDIGNKVFVYMYVPLDAEEQHADNVVMLDHDIFKLGD